MPFENIAPNDIFRPTYECYESFIDDFFKQLQDAPLGRMGIDVCIDIGIDGYLRRVDALKIYEIAYFCDGEILELGTHKGLSSIIISKAISHRDNHLHTVDIDPDSNIIAKENANSYLSTNNIIFYLNDATVQLDEFIKLKMKFNFIFVDHWHGYKSTKDAITRIRKLLNVGGFVLFHDFCDNSTVEYGVLEAVIDEYIHDNTMIFCGIFGCCSLFRKIKE